MNEEENRSHEARSQQRPRTAQTHHQQEAPILIVGAGLAGALLAAQLAGRGHHVAVLEKRGDMRREQMVAGRSINLALAERGFEGLRRAGAIEAVKKYLLPMRGRMVHDRAGATNFQTYGLEADEVIWSVHRGRLNQSLLDIASAAGARLGFHARLKHVDFDARIAQFVDEESGRDWHEPFTVLIGADGAGSAVRGAIDALHGDPAHTDFLDHGYKELHIPPAADGGFALAPDALHIWPRGGFMLIALPNPDHSFTATLFLANTGAVSFAALDGDAAVADFFAREFADAQALVPDLLDQFRANPTGLLGTLRCDRWHERDRALLIGDAAHAIVPFHGQGMNCAFEDCVALLDLVEAAPRGDDGALPWGQIFERFVFERRPNAHAIGEMALENYIEMRNAVADSGYQLRRQLELELARRIPEHFVPRYSLVMFHRIPYADARERGKLQLALLHELTAAADSLEDIDIEQAVEIARARLPLLDPK